jgi:hypothetical protein
MKREGYVYFIGSAAGPIKVGWARNPDARLREFQTGSPDALILLGAFRVNDPRKFEGVLHTALDRARIRGEWFKRDHALAPLAFAHDHADEYGNLSEDHQLGATLAALIAPVDWVVQMVGGGTGGAQ